MIGVRPAEDYLRAHPEVWGWTGKQLATISDPKFTVVTWLKAKRVVEGRVVTVERPAPFPSKAEIGATYLQQHPELHHLSGRSLAEQVSEPSLSYHTWNDAKRKLRLILAPKFNGVDRKYQPRREVISTDTYGIDLLRKEVRVKTTSGKDDCHEVRQWRTLDFLAWKLEQDKYQKRTTMHGIIYTKTERA